MRKGLGDRLETCLSLIEGAECMVDVGTDHGKLPVYALLEGRTKRAVAVDVSSKSLQKARTLAEERGVALETILGDGLTLVSERDADIVVIAGMGGYEIVKILEEAPFRIRKCILVPHTHASVVRRYLKENDVAVLRDIMVSEGKHFYPVLLVDYRERWQGADNVYVGKEGAALEAYIRQRLDKIESYLVHNDDPLLKEEKEILTNVYRK